MQHLEGLCAVGLDPSIWTWMPANPRTPDEMREVVAAALRDQSAGVALPFATIDRATDRVVGSTRYLAITPEHRRVEIGWTWIAPAWQRTAINTEAKYLMLRHAFEKLECVRVELKTDRLNERSRAAIQRIGAQEEGTLRSHMLMPGGRLRDTVYYSILAPEWPGVKAELERKLRM